MGLCNYSHSVALLVYLLDFGTDQRVWHYWFFYGTLELYWQCAIICFSLGLWSSSDSVSIICFHMGFWNSSDSVSIICFSMEIWNSSDSVSIICFSKGLWKYSHSVALLMYLLDFETDQRVWHYLVFYWTLELFRQCDIICFSFFYWTFELFRQCGIICFYMGLWNCSDSVVLFVFIWDLGAVPTIWHY